MITDRDGGNHAIGCAVNHRDIITPIISAVDLVIGRIIDQSPRVTSDGNRSNHRIGCAINHRDISAQLISTVDLVID